MPAGRRIPRTKPSPAPRPPASGVSPPGGLAEPLAQAGADLAALVASVRACTACGRASQRRAFGSGYPRAPILLVKEAPSDADLLQETAFVSEAEALERAFDHLGIPPAWVYGTCAVRCSASPPCAQEVRACAPHLLVEIEAVGPSVIVCFGQLALEALRALDGRCGLTVPEAPEGGKPVPLREGLHLLVTEPLPQGLTDPQAKRRLWRDLRQLPSLVGCQGSILAP